jgi:cell division septum initiation protein DivIVA
MSEHPQNDEPAATPGEGADLTAAIPDEVSELFDLDPLGRVRTIDRLVEEHRQAMAGLAALRDNAIRELVETTSVSGAAEALGVTRQAVYKAFQERSSLTPSRSPMGTSLTQRKLEQLQKDVTRLQDKIARETRNQVSLSGRLARIRQQQAQTRSPATARSKQQEAERLEKSIVTSQRRRADVEKQVARKTEELHRNQSKLVKEQALERDRMLKQLEAVSRERERAALSALNMNVYRPTGEPGDLHGARTDRFDVFISHATEDKEDVARPLAEELQKLGLRVWYDGFELRIGDSLRRRIDDGLARSQFGIVVLSPAFFAKNWPQYELNGLVAKEMQDRRTVILPLWHKLSKDEVIRHSPSLADKVALSTAQFTIAELADKVNEAIQ